MRVGRGRHRGVWAGPGQRRARRPIEAQDAPSAAAGNATIYAPGLTLTVEPGIPIPNLSGIRAEKTVAVTQDCVVVLTA